ncbi:hypothetical protein C1H71_18600 [Iodobacter fluviatilis]|uniref:Uncharacterized protein n=1 Tax=Iodobacter fluviatilis TaxID=537 RepID=A0A7G3GCZ3_9NEIS|nr:hypothetical protein C1H71_18600 [Iodobacter fluviatilis]
MCVYHYAAPSGGSSENHSVMLQYFALDLECIIFGQLKTPHKIKKLLFFTFTQNKWLAVLS